MASMLISSCLVSEKTRGTKLRYTQKKGKRFHLSPTSRRNKKGYEIKKTAIEESKHKARKPRWKKEKEMNKGATVGGRENI